MPNLSSARRSPMKYSKNHSAQAVTSEGDFRRVQSTRSATTPRRPMIDLAQAQGNAMSVYVRVRPFSQRELSMNMPQHSTVRIDVDNPCLITLLDPQKEFRPRDTFSFTRCFWSVLEKDCTGNKTAQEICDTIDTFITNNTLGLRGARNRGLPVSGQKLIRERTTNDMFVSSDASGSNAVVIAGSSVAHPPYSSQEDVYNEVGRPVLENTLEGYNGCVFAYGQTGSGKTFTMLGYTPKHSEIYTGSRRCSAVNYYDEDDDAEHSKSLLNSVQPVFYRHTSFASSHTSQKDTFDRQVSTQGLTDHAGDIPDTPHLDPNELQGIIPRIAIELFKGLRAKRDKDPSHSYRVEIEYYEIYNERVYDLIYSQKDADLKIRHNPVSGPYVEGITTKVVSNEKEIVKIISRGSLERHTAATKINDRSSRSHAIIKLNVVQLYLDEADNTCKKQSKLNLVDLAGSERTGAVGAEGMQFIEGTKINLSLTTLGRVIDCLADLSQSKTLSVPVPYRDSNLTWLLMDSLGGNSKTSMIATISPHSINFDEMRQTVRYASRAKQIVNTAVINEDPQVRQIRQLTAEVDRLKKVIHDADYNEFSRDYVMDLQRRSALLDRRCHEQEKTIVHLRAELEEHDITTRADYGRTASPKYGYAARSTETSARRCRNFVDEKNNGSSFRSLPLDSKAEAEAKKQENEGELSQVPLLKSRIQRLMNEIGNMQINDSMKQRQIDSFALFCSGYAFDVMYNTMVRKEDLFMGQVAHSIIAKCNQISGNVRHVQKIHREEMDELRKQHKKELNGMQELSKCRLRESIEKSSELYQQLIDKHMFRMNYLEEQLKKEKEFYDTEKKRMETEKEKLCESHEKQLAKMRAEHKQEITNLREQINSLISERKRINGETVMRKQQDDFQKKINQLQEEIIHISLEKQKETSQLSQQLEKERLRWESSLLEKDRQCRLIEHEKNTIQSELQKVQNERNHIEQQHHTEVQNLEQQQEKLVNVGNRLISDWDNRSTAVESTLNTLRNLLQNHDYSNYRARIRELTFERKDYTAELEAVEERKQRDTQFLRDILQQLRENQEGSMASIRRFEEDVMKHLTHTQPSLATTTTTNNNNNNNNNNK